MAGVVSTIAALACAWLLASRLAGPAVLPHGCGDEGGCGQILAGRWSTWMHVPVTALAGLVHGAVAIVTLGAGAGRGWTSAAVWTMRFLGWLIVASAAYFTYLLVVVERETCIWCLSLHAAGIVVSLLLAVGLHRWEDSAPAAVVPARWPVGTWLPPLAALVAVGVLAAGQRWGPAPPSHTVTSSLPTAAAAPTPVAGPVEQPLPGRHGDGGEVDEASLAREGAAVAGAAAAVPAERGMDGDSDVPKIDSRAQTTSPAAAGNGRLVVFGADFSYDATELPILGSPAADVILVEYFDYTCRSCRDFAGKLAELVAVRPGDVAIIILPVPLDRSCNDRLSAGVRDHPGSCVLAELALACWRADRRTFPALHEHLLAMPLPIDPACLAEARSKAEELVGAAPLAAALADPWPRRQLAESIAAYARLARHNATMPKLLLTSSMVLNGTVRTARELVGVVEQQCGLDPARRRRTPSGF